MSKKEGKNGGTIFSKKSLIFKEFYRGIGDDITLIRKLNNTIAFPISENFRRGRRKRIYLGRGPQLWIRAALFLVYLNGRKINTHILQKRYFSFATRNCKNACSLRHDNVCGFRTIRERYLQKWTSVWNLIILKKNTIFAWLRKIIRTRIRSWGKRRLSGIQGCTFLDRFSLREKKIH